MYRESPASMKGLLAVLASRAGEEIYASEARANGHEPGFCMIPPIDSATTVFVAEDIDTAWGAHGPDHHHHPPARPAHPPPPSPRAAPGAAAAEVRKARADLKEQLKNGQVTLAELLDRAESDDVIGKLKVVTVLQALPGIGKVKATQTMEKLKIADSRRLRGLGEQQRKALLNEFAA
jgi:hypothetical protein